MRPGARVGPDSRSVTRHGRCACSNRSRTRRCEVAEGPEEHDSKETAEGDPLRLVLHTMEEQLDDRVEAVSESGPSRQESTSDLIRLEETLSSAQDKAKQLVTLRLKLEEEETTSNADAPSSPPESTD